MKKEYDFSNARRGQFFVKNAKFNMPVYLNKETFSFVERLAENRRTDLSTIVNDLLKSDIQLAQIMK